MRKIQSYEQISYQIAKNTEKYESYEELSPGYFECFSFDWVFESATLVFTSTQKIAPIRTIETSRYFVPHFLGLTLNWIINQ